jgi:hypothetical protein
MITILDTALVLPMRDIAGILLDAGAKSVAVLAVAGVALVCMRRRSASAWYMVCFRAVASLPLLPLLSYALPGWRGLPPWTDLREPSSASSLFTSSTPSTPSHNSTHPAPD